MSVGSQEGFQGYLLLVYRCHSEMEQVIKQVMTDGACDGAGNEAGDGACDGAGNAPGVFSGVVVVSNTALLDLLHSPSSL